MSLRILQFGTTGQVGRELARQAVAYPHELVAVSRADCDFANCERAAEIVAGSGAGLVINAVAYTAVDQAESDAETAHRVNAETAGAIAAACARSGAALAHISTDYVFDGETTAPYGEDDATGPNGVYGASKLAGEREVLEACDRAVVLRTSWVVSAHGKNFVKTMLRLARDGRQIRVVDDQFGRPTSAADLAGFLLANAERLATAPAGDPVYGLFHFANAGETTWRRFAEAVFDEALGAEAPQVEPIGTADYPTPARRPKRSTLDTGKLERVYGYAPRPWRSALKEIVAELMVEERAQA